MTFQVGDIVARKSYNADIHFRIVYIDEVSKEAELKGLDIRLWADAPLQDLIMIDEDTRDKVKTSEAEWMSSSIREIKEDREDNDSFFELPGRVLHIDGDANYLGKCLRLYEELHVPVYGIHIAEAEIAEKLEKLLRHIRPDVLVLTGHDAFMRSKGNETDIRAYRNTRYYREAVLVARQFERNRDQLVIFAGGCQSYFETLIQAGANFASSPKRVNIHALDPVYVAQKACYTSIDRLVNIQEAMQYSITGSSGLGGIDTRGTHRIGRPSIFDGQK